MLGMILVDDRRYEHTQAFLEGLGHSFCEPKADPKALDFMIFPFAGPVDEGFYDNDYFAAAKKDAVVFSGIKNAHLAKMCALHGLEYHAVILDESVAQKNAVPTSEGVIAYLITSMERTIAGSHLLVIGYGNCGRDLARRLAALDARVYALVRNVDKEMAALGDGIAPIYIDELHEHDFGAIINTVPAKVLSDDAIAQLGGTMLVEIASAPYGFDMDLAQKYNARSALLAGIPGKYAIRTAGEILGQYIDNTISQLNS